MDAASSPEVRNGKRRQFSNIRRPMGKGKIWMVKGFARGQGWGAELLGCARAPGGVDIGIWGGL